jgi:hypothetical protein
MTNEDRQKLIKQEKHVNGQPPFSPSPISNQSLGLGAKQADPGELTCGFLEGRERSTEVSSPAWRSPSPIPIFGNALADRRRGMINRFFSHQVGQRRPMLFPIHLRRRSPRRLPRLEPLSEKGHHHFPDRPPLARSSGLHLTVELLGKIKGRFHGLQLTG